MVSFIGLKDMRELLNIKYNNTLNHLSMTNNNNFNEGDYKVISITIWELFFGRCY